jgi:hypothetical protein
MSSLRINFHFLQLEWKTWDEDKAAAWELYIEMITRIVTQELKDEDGDEETALKSIYSLFGTTREVIRRNGRGCGEFTKIAIVVLNQVVRPFTAKWHKKSLEGAFKDSKQCKDFRKELKVVQKSLKQYTKMLADMAGVEDLSNLQATLS